jgi:CNT family concentrative nucleoside transporter
MDYLRALGGLVFIVGIAWLFSTNRKAVDWKLVFAGILMQIIFGLLIAKVAAVQSAFEYVSAKFITFLKERSFSMEIFQKTLQVILT